MTDQHRDLPYEQARNREFLSNLADRRVNPRRQILANPMHITPEVAARDDYKLLHPLIGRVRFDRPDPDLGPDCYIGPHRYDRDDLRVISWAAPAAADIFFRAESTASELARSVLVRRTLTSRVNDLVGIDDEILRPIDGELFDTHGLSVPAPPPGTRRTRAERKPAGEASSTVDAPPRGAEQTPTVPGPVSGLRAGAAVIRQLETPRESRMRSVLATLQSDQHTQVTAPLDDSLIVQGHPGTGKTVIAAYRAGFIVNPATYDRGGVLENRRRFRVLLVGPTSAYVDHVRTLIEPLEGSQDVALRALDDLLIKATLGEDSWSGHVGGEYSDLDEKAEHLAESAFRLAWAQRRVVEGSDAARRNIKTIYELIKSNGLPGQPLTRDPDLERWVRRLPEFRSAWGQRRYLALMAQCRFAYKKQQHKYDHIIVDEAQDVSPNEWSVLRNFLDKDGHWTLVGDMNQRRSDTTFSSWQLIADFLPIGDGDEAMPVQELTRGYRSTNPILQFADKLLPAPERGNRSVQEDGPGVDVRHARAASNLVPTAVELGETLGKRHPKGTIALISVAPAEITRLLGKTGWRRRDRAFEWHRDDRTLSVLHPTEARGLEFDGVVVVEPGAFPQNLGRDGQLYTSLTRANRELAVVWHTKLPDALRHAARRSYK